MSKEVGELAKKDRRLGFLGKALLKANYGKYAEGKHGAAAFANGHGGPTGDRDSLGRNTRIQPPIRTPSEFRRKAQSLGLRYSDFKNLS